jgi:hypothetical protein
VSAAEGRNPLFAQRCFADEITICSCLKTSAALLDNTSNSAHIKWFWLASGAVELDTFGSVEAWPIR